MNLKFDHREAYYKKRRETRPLRICAFAAVCIFAAAALCWGYYWYIMQGEYSFTIQSQQRLTGETADAIGSRTGVQACSPILQENAVLKINDYEANVLLTGVDPDNYPLEYAAWVNQLFVGSQPVVLIGQDCFSALTDHNGHAILEENAKALFIACKKSLADGYGEDADWISEEERRIMEDHTEEFQFAIQMEGAAFDTIDTIIGGILRSPENEIVMSYENLRQLLADAAGDTGVYQVWVKVKGIKNAADLQEELAQTGVEADIDLVQQMETCQSAQRTCLLLMAAAGALAAVLYRYLNNIFPLTY